MNTYLYKLLVVWFFVLLLSNLTIHNSWHCPPNLLFRMYIFFRIFCCLVFWQFISHAWSIWNHCPPNSVTAPPLSCPAMGHFHQSQLIPPAFLFWTPRAGATWWSHYSGHFPYWHSRLGPEIMSSYLHTWRGVMDHNCFRNDDSIYFYPHTLPQRMQSNAHTPWKIHFHEIHFGKYTFKKYGSV